MNTNALKAFAQATRTKLVSLIGTKIKFVTEADTAELRGFEREIDRLKKAISEHGREQVIEEVAYTWFNRVMALRYMDANGYNMPMVVTPVAGTNRPEILQEAMSGNIDPDLRLSSDDMNLPEAKLYRRLLVAVCNRMGEKMPFLFEPIVDYTELLLPDDLLSEQSFVTDIRKGMSDEDCRNVEVMGWLYQFYITDRKADAENKKSKKGGLKSDEQAAATQLFTPHWIVRYMVENSLGRIWMTLHPESQLIDGMKYYVQSPEGQTDVIPEHIHSAKDITLLDPCMGSGHILVYAFDLLTKMYEEEGHQPKEIPAMILENNLYGMDIDRRCYQLASFALTMKAREYYSRYLRRTPVQPHVIALQPISHQTIEMSGSWDKSSDMWQFENIDTIGSLLKVSQKDADAIRVESGIFGQEQQLLKTQAEYLARKYDCVVTNPPYLGKGFCEALDNYVKKNYHNSKLDIMASFIEVCLNLCLKKGRIGMINQHSWMFITSYENLRYDILEHHNIESLLHLGAHAFDEIKGEKVQTASFVICKEKKTDAGGTYFRLVKGKDSKTKEQQFLKERDYPVYKQIDQTKFSLIPGFTLGYWVSDTILLAFSKNKFGDLFSVKKGADTGNNDYFLKLWHELSFDKIGITKKQSDYDKGGLKWAPYNKGGESRRWFGNNSIFILWENNGEELIKSTANLRSKHLYFKNSITWNALATDRTTARFSDYGAIFDSAGSSMFPQPRIIKYCLGLMNSKAIASLLEVLNPTLNFGSGTVSNIPFIENQIVDIENIVNQNISLSKEDWNFHETSWGFQENPLVVSIKDNCWGSVELAVADYKTIWANRFMQLHANEEELNRRFIEIYGLQDELTPDVPLDEVTILQKGEISIEEGKLKWHDDVIVKQLISYLVGCFMGRYSVDRPGLVIASQHTDLASLGLEVDGIDNGLSNTIAIDDDGIVPIVEEPDFFADDMAQRIELAIRRIFDDEFHQENMKYITKSLGTDLRTYTYKTLYDDHVQMYQKRPIYWLFSSKMGDKKKKGYFKALVYMHRIEGDTLSKLHADYVHPYIEKIEAQLAEAQDQAMRDDLSQSLRNKARKQAEVLSDKLHEVRAFEQELVKMASHRITIDLDDGVRANYPKYYPLVEPIKGIE